MFAKYITIFQKQPIFSHCRRHLLCHTLTSIFACHQIFSQKRPLVSHVADKNNITAEPQIHNAAPAPNKFFKIPWQVPFLTWTPVLFYMDWCMLYPNRIKIVIIYKNIFCKHDFLLKSLINRKEPQFVISAPAPGGNLISAEDCQNRRTLCNWI